MCHKKSGFLEAITGCMFSGKTDELIRRLERVEIAGRKYLLFKPSIDDRYKKTAVVSHRGIELPAVLIDSEQETVSGLLGALESANWEVSLEEADVVAFDEGNLFSKKLLDLCRELIGLGKRVIVSGLDLTYNQEPFEPMPQVMALAEEVLKLKAVCKKCGEPATKTLRTTSSKERIVVGGKDDYEAVCATCYARIRKEQEIS